MDYVDATKKLGSLGPELRASGAVSTAPPRKFSLEHIAALLSVLRNPQEKFPSVLIAGTNGKGSTAATLASIAAAAGLRTGLYTSPHLLRVNERICVAAGGADHRLEQIGDDDFARLLTRVDTAGTELVARGELPHYPSFFELLTAVGFCYFAERGVELAVLEVGLGGRLDATNVVDPLLSIITDIGMDHMEYLGSTLRAIAGEKAGILRDNGVLVTLSQHPEANAAIGEAAVAKNVRGVDAARCLPPRETARAANGSGLSERKGSPLARNCYDLSLEGQVLHVDSPLAGQHQQRNVALAIAAAIELRSNHGFTISNAAIEEGIRATVWPGRLEWMGRRGRTERGSSETAHAPVLLDVAHNPAGAWALRAAIAQLPEALPRTLLFSCLADKQIDEIMQVLLPLFDSTSGDPLRGRDHVVLALIQNPRAATIDQLLAAAQRLDVPAHAAPHVPAALAEAEAITPPEGIIVATGSIFLIGELRALLLAEEQEPHPQSKLA